MIRPMINRFIQRRQQQARRQAASVRRCVATMAAEF